METSASLFAYGILQEQSDIRAHVGVLSRCVYVFQTRLARELLSTNEYEQAPAKQPGVNGWTANGWKVPWKEIPDIRRLPFISYDWSVFREADSTSDKGRKAVDVVIALMKKGRFPLWLDAEESDNVKIQLKGTDIVLFNRKRIQVKCDWRCGEGAGCTGNIYLQSAERNPLGYK